MNSPKWPKADPALITRGGTFSTLIVLFVSALSSALFLPPQASAQDRLDLFSCRVCSADVEIPWRDCLAFSVQVDSLCLVLDEPGEAEIVISICSTIVTELEDGPVTNVCVQPVLCLSGEGQAFCCEAGGAGFVLQPEDTLKITNTGGCATLKIAAREIRRRVVSGKEIK